MSKKRQKTKYTFVCPLFGVEVTLCLGDRDKFLDEFLNDIGLSKTAAGGCVESTDIEGCKSFYVWVKDKTDYYDITHEALHLVQKIFEHTGIPFNADNQEIIAYYQNYWLRIFWDKMGK